MKTRICKVMDSINATESQLLACFGVEPMLLDKDIPWGYNTATYRTEHEGFLVSFAIAPAYRDVEVVLTWNNKSFFEFNAKGVRDVMVIDTPGVDAVAIILSDRSWLRLQLRPRLLVTQGQHREDARFDPLQMIHRSKLC